MIGDDILLFKIYSKETFSYVSNNIENEHRSFLTLVGKRF